MPGHRIALRTALIFLLTAAAAASQSTPLTRILGTVRGQDGQAWANARIVLSSGARFPGADFEDPVRLTLSADANGRFVARVDPRRQYALWAEFDVNGARRFTSYVLTSPLVHRYDLRESPEQPMRLRVRLYGMEPWKRHGPLRFSLLEAEGRGAPRPLELINDEELELPPGPGMARIRIDSRHGFVSAHWVPRHLSVRRRWMGQIVGQRQRWQKMRESFFPALPNPLGDGLPSSEEGALLLPRPIRWRFRCRHNESEKHIQGIVASLENPDAPYEQTRFTSDADGLIEVVLPAIDTLEGVWPAKTSAELFFSKPGLGSRVVELDHEHFWLRHRLQELDLVSCYIDGIDLLYFEDLSPIEIELQNANARERNSTYAVRAGISDSFERDKAIADRLLLLRPNDKGKLLIPGPAREQSAWWKAGRLSITRLAAREPGTTQLVPLLRGADLMPIRIPMQERASLRVRVKLPSGAPPRGALLRYLHGRGSHPSDDRVHQPWLVVPRNGLIELPRTSELISLWVESKGHVGALGGKDLARAEHPGLTLHPPMRITGRAFGQDGDPAPGLFLQARRPRRLPPALGNIRAMLEAANRRLAPVQTDADGRFELLAFVPFPLEVYVCFWEAKGIQSNYEFHRADLDPARDTDFEVRLFQLRGN